jgi:hypothetical protein
MRNVTCVGSILAALMVAGCGGGGGGSSAGLNSTPAAPSISKSTSLLNVTQNDEFAASIAAGRGTYSNSGLAITSNATLSNTTVRYDSATKGYSIETLPISTATKPSFTDSNKLLSSNAILTAYGKTTGTRDDQLYLFNPGSGNPTLALTYASYGAWLSIDDRNTSADVTIAYFAFGTRTSSADMPRSGSASYTTTLDGSFVDSSGIYALSGSSSFSADFGANSVSVAASPFGVNALDGSTRNFGSFNGNGTIDSNAAQFNIPSVGSNGYTFAMKGHFYGPSAAEMGGVFSLNGNAGTGMGAIVGKKN